MSRRQFLLLLLTSFAAAPLSERAQAKDGESGSDNSGSGSSGSDNSGSDSDNSGSDDSGSDDSDDGDDNSGEDNSGSSSQNSGKYKDQYGAQQAVKSGSAISLEEALKKLRLRHPGRVIAVNLGQSGKRLVYWFKVKSADGNVRKVVMDARTGAIRGLLGFGGS